MRKFSARGSFAGDNGGTGGHGCRFCHKVRQQKDGQGIRGKDVITLLGYYLRQSGLSYFDDQLYRSNEG